MHKKFTLSVATILATTTVTPTVFANDSPLKEQIEDTVEEEGTIGDSVFIENDEEAEEPKEEETEETEEPEEEEEIELIYNLSLEDAIDHGINNNYSLMSLEYNLKNAKSQLAGTEDKYKEQLEEIEDLEDKMEELRKLQRETGVSTFQARYEIQELLKKLDDVIDEFEDGIEGLKTSEKITEYTNEQTKEMMPFQITSTYLQMIMQDEQLKLQKESLVTQKQQAEKAKREYEIGVASKSDYDTALREVKRLESQIYETEDSLQKDLSVFAIDIGIAYHSDLKLRIPRLEEVKLVTQKIDTNELIENSYAMKIAEEKLELELYNQEQIYEDKDADKFDEEQADIAVELAHIEIAETKRDAQRAISELYMNIRNQYYNVEDATREIGYAKEDLEKMKKRYEIGIISRDDYESSKMQLTQAEMTLQLELYQYSLLTKQADLLESGVILIN